MPSTTARGEDRGKRYTHRAAKGVVPLAVRTLNRNRVHKVQRVTHLGVLVFHPRCNVDYAEELEHLDAEQLSRIPGNVRCKYRWCFGTSTGPVY